MVTACSCVGCVYPKGMLCKHTVAKVQGFGITPQAFSQGVFHPSFLIGVRFVKYPAAGLWGGEVEARLRSAGLGLMGEYGGGAEAGRGDGATAV